MTTIWKPKAPEEVVFRQISWIGELQGDEIATNSLTVLPNTSSITLTDIAFTADSVTATVSGGLDCELAVLQNEIATLDGRTLVQIITMAIVDAATLPPGGTSTTTKQTLVNMAFEEIGLAGYEFDITPEEQTSALRRLDALMRVWEGPGNNMALGYNFPAVLGQGDLSDATGIADNAVDATVQQLALRVMPLMGKTMSPETRLAYAQNMTALRTAYALKVERRLAQGTPIGIGNKPWSVWQPFGFRGGQ